jgi:subtilisin family serine protease
LAQSTHIIGADVAWGYGYAGQGWYVAILDTGIRRTHAMFQGKNIVEQCYSDGEDYNNGDIGDCPNGRTEMSGVGAAAHYQSRFYHGTHVSGIAAGNDSVSHFGVARDAGIIAVQVFSYFSAEDDVMSWTSDQLKGLEYIYLIRNTYKIAAINMSLGGGSYSSYCSNSSRAQIIANLRAAGIPTVVASGNDASCNSISDPACVPGVIAVNGTDKQDKEYFYGNWSNLMVSLMAPGEYITSAVASSDTSYGTASGTSMATPHVTGAWAIIKSFDANLAVDDILKTFKDTGVMISSDHCAGNTPKPRINVGDALATLFRIAPPVNIAGEQVTNEAFLQKEYINVLTWEDNPRNANKNVAFYRVYQVNGAQDNLLAEVPVTTHTYLVRNVGKRIATTYAFSSVDTNGNESPLYNYTLAFGITQ